MKNDKKNDLKEKNALEHEDLGKVSGGESPVFGKEVKVITSDPGLVVTLPVLDPLPDENSPEEVVLSVSGRPRRADEYEK